MANAMTDAQHSSPEGFDPRVGTNMVLTLKWMKKLGAASAELILSGYSPYSWAEHYRISTVAYHFVLYRWNLRRTGLHGGPREVRRADPSHAR